MRVEIENGAITRFEVGGMLLSLKKPVPLKELRNIEDVVRKLEEYIDLNQLRRSDRSAGTVVEANWTPTEMKDFLNALTSAKPNIGLFFECIGNETVSRRELLDCLSSKTKTEFRNDTLRGIQRTLGESYKKWKKPRIHEQFKEHINGNKTLRYRIRDEYKPVVSEWLADRDD